MIKIQCDWDLRIFYRLFICRVENLILGDSLQKALIDDITVYTLFSTYFLFCLSLSQERSLFRHKIFLSSFFLLFFSQIKDMLQEDLSGVVFSKQTFPSISGSWLLFYNQICSINRSLLCCFIYLNVAFQT